MKTFCKKLHRWCLCILIRFLLFRKQTVFVWGSRIFIQNKNLFEKDYKTIIKILRESSRKNIKIYLHVNGGELSEKFFELADLLDSLARSPDYTISLIALRAHSAAAYLFFLGEKENRFVFDKRSTVLFHSPALYNLSMGNLIQDDGSIELCKPLKKYIRRSMNFHETMMRRANISEEFILRSRREDITLKAEALVDAKLQATNGYL